MIGYMTGEELVTRLKTISHKERRPLSHLRVLVVGDVDMEILAIERIDYVQERGAIIIEVMG